MSDVANDQPTPGGCRIGCLLCLLSTALVIGTVVLAYLAAKG